MLFICNQNKNRSKTAEELFKENFNTKSAGLYNENPVNEEEISWADIIIVMEDKQRSEIAKRFPKSYMEKRILSLDVPDIYLYNDPELVDVLRSKMQEVGELF
ncbi:phosphotyrosine protein phosphatase [Candidatus Woesearchaeota archaeon]|nr:phosphotyrosine protein phosphatase [Candidatus Woesearchaeota archaeon]